MQRCLLTLILGLGLGALSGGGLAAGLREVQADENQADKSQADENQADESQADKVELVVPDEPDAPDEQREGESEAKDGEETGTAEKRLDEGGPEAGGSIRLVDPASKDLLEKVSYVFGLEIGQEIKRRGVAVDLELLSQGINDGAAGTPAVSPQEIEATMMAFNSMRLAERKALAEKNKKEEERFLAANKKKKGVKTLPSGLQYKVVKRGNGRSPKLTDKVSVHYRGRLIDGTEFEDSFDRGQPVELPIQDFIPGWKEALPLMREGDKWELVVPSRLAFADQGDPRHPIIGPNATLLYEIELVAVVSGTNR